MSEEERLGWIIGTVTVICVLAVCVMVVLCVKFNNARLGPAQKHQYERQIEAIRACTHGTDVGLCIHNVLGP